MFDLIKTPIYRTLRIEKFFNIIEETRKLFLAVLFISLFLSLITQSQKWFSFSILSLVIFLASKILALFFNLKLKRVLPRVSLETVIDNPEGFNLAEFLDFKAAKTIWKSIRFAKAEKTEIRSIILFHFLLEMNPKLSFIFERGLASFKEIKNILKKNLKNPSGKNLPDIVLEAIKEAKKRQHKIVEVGDFLIILAREDPTFQKFLIEKNLFIEDIENLTWWLENLERQIRQEKRFWEYENLIKHGALATDWAAGYTIALDQYSVDWTRILKHQRFKETVGQEETIESIERVLAKEDLGGGTLLVGEAGAGRKSVIHGFAKKVFLGASHPNLNYKRILELDLAGLFARAETEEEAESLLDAVFSEAVIAKNIILIIDDFHLYVSGKTKPGIVDITGIFSKYLKFPQLKIIGICDWSGFHKYIEPNQTIMSFFDKIEIPEASEQETLLILESRVPFYETKYKRFISYPALRDIVRFSARYLPGLPFPTKAVEILEEIMIYVSRYSTSKVVLPEDVAKLFRERVKIPVGEIEKREKEVLLNLEDLIHKRIIDQEEGVKEISQALRRARSGITIRKGPIGAFLFLGPTGVGKTETSKALAEIYFGSESEMIRLDMSEFQDKKDISRLIGGPEEEGLLTTRAREKPFSLILLDEIEKAHPDILNLFLQVFDEGHLTDGLGRKVSFRDSIIIATSNAGYEIILDAIKKKTEWSAVKGELQNFLFEKGTFRPEFINRFDAVVVFKPLNKENLLEIAGLMLNKLKENLAAKHVEFIINKSLKEKIVRLGYSPIFGAREMRRVIQEKIENPLAVALLKGEIKRGNRVEVDPRDPRAFRLMIQ